MNIGGHNEFGRIERLLLKKPGEAFRNQSLIDDQWESLRYAGRPDLATAIQEYKKFHDLLKAEIAEIEYLPADDRTGLDSLYVRDAAVITDAGAILCRMGKSARAGEPEAMRDYFVQQDIPILGEISGDGYLEGGDLIWLAARTLAVGRGYRTNGEGIAQLRDLTADLVDEFIIVPLPHWEGPGDVLHLMSMISPIDVDLAVVYSRLLPVPFRQWLIDRGMDLIEVPDEEYESMACNILAIAPRRCIMLAGNPRTRRLLESEGVVVYTYQGDEISRKGAGGPTCLTRPLWRTG